MKILLRITLYALLPTLFFAQAPDTAWTKTYGGGADEIGWAVQQTSDDGYIIVGCTKSIGAGQTDIWLLKTDSMGNIEWNKTYGGYDYESGYSVQETNDNGYIFVGYTTSYGEGEADIYLIRVNNSGDTVWTKTYGDSTYEEGVSIQLTNDHGFILGSSDMGYDPYSAHGIAIKLDSLGNVEWQTGSMSVVSAVIQTFNGKYTGVGTIYDAMPYSYFAACQIDSNGQIDWIYPYYDFGYLSGGYDVIQTVDSNYIAVGYDNGPGIILAKLTREGDTIWRKQYQNNTSAYALTEIDEKGFIVVGDICTAGNYDMLILRTDTTGNAYWMQSYGGIHNETAYDVENTRDGGYIIVGYTESYGSGNKDIWLLKLAPDTLGIQEQYILPMENRKDGTIFTGPLHFSMETDYKIFDIIGRQIHTLDPAPGIYFIEIDGTIKQKVIKIR